MLNSLQLSFVFIWKRGTHFYFNLVLSFWFCWNYQLFHLIFWITNRLHGELIVSLRFYLAEDSLPCIGDWLVFWKAEQPLPSGFSSNQLTSEPLDIILEQLQKYFRWLLAVQKRVSWLLGDSFLNSVPGHLIGQVLQHHAELKRQLTLSNIIPTAVY